MAIRPYHETLETTSQDKTYTVEQGEFAPLLFVCFFIISIFSAALSTYRFGGMGTDYENEMADLREIMTEEIETAEKPEDSLGTIIRPEIIPENNMDKKTHQQTLPDANKLADMEQLYAINPDIIGWLTIDDTNVDYPVMQSMYDEQYYLDRDFNKNYSSNGSLIMDTDSCVGSGTLLNEYADGTLPSTNLIVHGHNMKSGAMFGNLDLYRKQSYEQSHNIIKLTTLTEKREYEIMCVFLSQVYLKSQTDVFKYYQFFEANNEDEFNNFYNNVKQLQLYDTGVTAEYGDEFITLSVCAYHVENGRLVVVGKRIK